VRAELAVAYHRRMRFSAPWDRTLRITSTVTVGFLVCVLGPSLWFLLRAARESQVPGTGIAAFVVAGAVVATIGLAWALAPKGYKILGPRLIVERPLRRIEIPLATVRTAVADDGALSGARRVAGSGGLFGYYGRFWSRRLGAFRAYVTRRTGLVVIDTDAERFVLSPEPVGRFLEALRAHAPAASSVPLAPRPMPRGAKAGIAVLVALAPLALAAVVLGIWAWTPVAARVEGGEIRVERRLAGAVVIPLSDVHAVRPLAPEQVRRLGRVAGTALPGGVRYGHFRSRELGDVQLYAWRGEGHVLLETGGGRVVLTPDDPDAFVAAVRAGLAAPR
jgi:hypothetical protein